MPLPPLPASDVPEGSPNELVWYTHPDVAPGQGPRAAAEEWAKSGWTLVEHPEKSSRIRAAGETTTEAPQRANSTKER